MFRRFLSLLTLAALMAIPAAVNAQASPDTRHGFGSTPNHELYGGYSYVFRTYNPSTFVASTSGMNGWDASFKVPVLGSFLGIKGDVSGFYRNDGPNFNPKGILRQYENWLSVQQQHGRIARSSCRAAVLARRR